jgi:hypothetical protein
MKLHYLNCRHLLRIALLPRRYGDLRSSRFRVGSSDLAQCQSLVDDVAEQG